MSMALLEVQNVSKYFGGTAALDGVSLEVRQGEMVGLIGPNGSGKSTMFNVVTGILEPSKGKVFLDGTEITGTQPHSTAKHGIGRTFQLTSVLPKFTVFQNVLVATHMHSQLSFWNSLFNTPLRQRRDKEQEAEVEEILAATRLIEQRDQLASSLSGGSQKCLAIAMALATKPKLLMLDEPVASLSPTAVSEIMRLVARLKKDGVTIFFVEHNMRAIMDYCDRIIVLNFGRKIAEGTPLEVQANREVIEAYLGG